MELVLVLALAASPSFSNLMPTGTAPPVRRSCNAALIPNGTNDTQISYGGFNSGGTLSDLIHYSTSANTWTTAASTIAARERHSMGFDPVHNVVVIFDGVSGISVQDSVFLLDPMTYAESTPGLPAMRPSARCDALMEWVPPMNKFVVFGGRTSVLSSTHVNDTWTLDVSDGGATWAPVGITGPPTARGATCHAWDPVHGQILMFGGEGAADLGDTWSFTPDAGWNPLTVSGNVPAARNFSACAWEPNAKQLVLYGGQIGGTASGGLYTFDPATNVWSSFSPGTNPGVLSDAAAAFSPALGGVIFFAGRSATTTYTNGTWLLKLDQPPVADAGADFSVGEATMSSLSGSGTDPDMDALTYSWIEAGGLITLSSTTVPAPTFTTPRVTANTPVMFTLTVSDGTLTASSSVTVTILNTIDEPPVADAGPDQTVSGGALVQLSGSGTDPNGDAIAAYAWNLAGPNMVNLSSAFVAAPTFVAPTYPIDTTLMFSLTVSDGMLQSLPASMNVVVRATDAGTADAGVDAGMNGGTDGGMTGKDGGMNGGTDAGSDAGSVDMDGGADGGSVTGTDAGEDAGTDAGQLDGGGGLDAGLDAGSAGDGGPEDAGDGGESAGDGGEDAGDGGWVTQKFRAGCGCSSSPLPGVGLLLALLLRRRRRK
jgi:hypothetical protein